MHKVKENIRFSKHKTDFLFIDCSAGCMILWILGIFNKRVKNIVK